MEILLLEKYRHYLYEVYIVYIVYVIVFLLREGSDLRNYKRKLFL